MSNIFLDSINRAKTMLNGIRVKPNTGKASESNIDVDNKMLEDLLNEENFVISNINEFRQLSSNRCEQYDAYDEMEKDASIAAALKMYADDATQYNLDGYVIWVESENPTIAEFGNRLLRVLKINENAWKHIYNLVKYGDVYLETFYDDEIDDNAVETSISGGFGTSVLTHKLGARIEEYVEMVHDPASIFELVRRGKTCGFIRMNNVSDQMSNYKSALSINLSGTDQDILPSDKFIHILLSEESNRFPETFDIASSEGGNTTYTQYTVNKGKSLLEDVFKSYRELKLMEDSVLLNRVTRSSITRILQVEVGDMPKQQVREKLRQIKMMVEQKNFMDKNQGDFTNMASPGPVDNIIYVPTRNGNGAITSSTLGGDVDPKSLIDLEYYQQKEAGSLGVPLAYLNSQSGDGGGLSSGTALTKLDNRYARAVKRIQIAYSSGIQNLINIFAIRKGLPQYVNEFKVRMLSPSTIEDSDRDEQLNNRIGMVSDMMNLVDELYSEGCKKSILEYLFSTFLNKPEITDKLSSDSQHEYSEDEESTENTRGSTSYDNSSSNFDRMTDLDYSLDSTEDSDSIMSQSIDLGPREKNDSEEVAEPESSFGDFEEFA